MRGIQGPENQQNQRKVRLMSHFTDENTDKFNIHRFGRRICYVKDFDRILKFHLNIRDRGDRDSESPGRFQADSHFIFDPGLKLSYPWKNSNSTSWFLRNNFFLIKKERFFRLLE